MRIKKQLKIILFLVGIFSVLFVMTAIGLVIEGQKIDKISQVKFLSMGCFNGDEIDIQIDEEQAVIHRINRNSMNGNKSKIEKIYLGETTLSKLDIEGLNDLVSYYEEDNEGICTSWAKIEIKYLSRSGDYKSKKFVDNSCGIGMPSTVLTIEDLVERVSTEN